MECIFFGKDSETLEQKSARGGHHYIFKASCGSQYPGELCRGVDKTQWLHSRRASVFDGKRYEMFNDNDPAMVPSGCRKVVHL